MVSQLAMSASQTTQKMDDILNHISDISTGRAPLNISISITKYRVLRITATSLSHHNRDALLSKPSTSLAADSR
ncbi:hypothetical protein [Parasitella parasitica]|uniref:Uncharacterized protein n=1 Tax=Parasitella parasitica TaxID=35722 RepID=A0A0B7NGH8_9FUNG|nr:hypothetical protein [Parasitella parasitica]